jgi:hypothetical protein
VRIRAPQFRTHLPIKKRAELLAKIAKGTDSPFAQLKAIERADELDGILTEGERLRIPRERDQHQPRPIFMLESGASIAVTVNRKVTDDDEPINITPPAVIEPTTPADE